MKTRGVYSLVGLLAASIVCVALVPGPLWSYALQVALLWLAVGIAFRWLAGFAHPVASVWPEHPESGDFAGIDVHWRVPVPGFWEVTAEAEGAKLTASGWYGFGRHSVRLEHPEVRRGVHEYTVRWTYRDPLGLFVRRLPWEGRVEMAVRPRTVPMPAFEVLRGVRGALVGRRHARRSEAPAGVRRYEPGDRLTEVHWPQTLRTGETQVRDAYTRGASQRTIALDTRAAVYPDPASFELAVSVAASLALSLARRGEAVALAAGETVVTAQHATPSRLLDVLTRVSLGEGPEAIGGGVHGLIYIGTAQGAAALRAAQQPLAYAIAVGRDAHGEDLAIPNWPALYALARGVRAAR
jgi:uncharacterized protein (DUF58 family)